MQRRRENVGRAPLDGKVAIQHDVHSGVFAVANVGNSRTASLGDCGHRRLAGRHLPDGLRQPSSELHYFNSWSDVAIFQVNDQASCSTATIGTVFGFCGAAVMRCCGAA